jgi:predicted nucleic acid-binding protein
MARSVFLDTNGWLALLNATEVLHSSANDVWRELGASGCRILLTDWVIAETGNGSSRLPLRTSFVTSINQLWQSPRVDVVNVDDSFLKRSLDHFHRHADKTWGLADCASFLVMHDRGISEAFTSDRHFQQAGFKCLL